jgi:hypothetical protein
LIVAEIDVLHAEAENFEEAETAAVKEVNHEPVVAFEMGENGAGFGACEDDGKLRRPVDPLDTGDELELPLKDMLVKEEQRAEGLILRGGSNVTVDCKVAEEGGDLRFAEGAGVAFAVVKDETANPIAVGGLGPDAVTPGAEVPPDAIEELRRCSGRKGGWREHLRG